MLFLYVPLTNIKGEAFYILTDNRLHRRMANVLNPNELNQISILTQNQAMESKSSLGIYWTYLPIPLWR